MNDEENEVVYPTVTEETKHLGAQLIDSLTLGEQPPEMTSPTGDESDTTSTTPDASKDAVEQTVEEEPTLFGEGYKKAWQETNKFDAKNPLTWAHIPAAAGAGVTDFGIDVVNKIPHVNIPKLPRYEDETLNFVRDISGFVIPQMYMAKYLTFGSLALNAKLKWKLGQGAFAKFFVNDVIKAGTGTFLYDINKNN